jgi:UDP-N-acetylmuramoyl-L-alanyl-D-glutamate--2,6-diaminopimelate ligase
MNLSTLLHNVPVSKLFQTMYGRMVVTHDVEVNRVQYDSRSVKPGDAFVAIRGAASDGHTFLSQVMNSGAKVIVVERDDAVPDSLCMHEGVIKVVVQDSRKALAVMSANSFGRPANALRICGITGTNGKTTTSHLVRSVLNAAGERTGLIGTIEYHIGSTVVPATHTTPESLELHQLFAQMRDAGCTAVSMEVSSHALDQSRAFGIDFETAIFTNLTQDHLDYHRSMERYFAAKKILFESLRPEATAVVNADDRWSIRLIDGIRARTRTYGIESSADHHASDVEMSVAGTTFRVTDGNDRISVTTPLIGRFNVANVLAAYAAGRSLGYSPEIVKAGIADVKNVRGRFERISSPKGWTAIVDYAHTPDALENCLKTIRHLISSSGGGRVITVFGAGGDRDRMKRPLMGTIAMMYSTMVIVTSDNPRTEQPEAIIDDIMSGIEDHSNVVREGDRRKAIEHALSLAMEGDVVLIAGKGHEDYQVIGKEKMHFSDREVVEGFIG